MLDTGAAWLDDFWYVAFPGRALKPGRTLAKTLFGEPLLFGRTDEGQVFALRDICPHRGIPLSHGRFDGREVACRYHGWRFAPDGRCTAIPSLVPGQDFDCGRIKVQSYALAESQGLVWIFRPAKAGTPPPGPPPQMPGFAAEARPAFDVLRHFPCGADHAIYGLMDPTHAAFVHTSWWWKKDAAKLRQKTKHFEPAPLGWRMKRHRLPPENRMYRPFGRVVTTEISYQLPGLRIEQVQSERHTLVGLTAITPLDAKSSEVHQVFWWTPKWMTLVRPLLRHFAGSFLDQDRDVVVLQQEGLRHNPALLLIDDADTQAKWYFRVKREWLRAAEEGRAFENPLREKTLTWKS